MLGGAESGFVFLVWGGQGWRGAAEAKRCPGVRGIGLQNVVKASVWSGKYWSPFFLMFIIMKFTFLQNSQKKMAEIFWLEWVL